MVCGVASSRNTGSGSCAGVSEDGAGKENMLLYQFRHNFLHIIIVDLSAEFKPVRLNGIT